MAEWIYFFHPPRDNSAATMIEEERAAFAAPTQWLGRLLAGRVLILAGPTSAQSTPTRTWTAEDGSARYTVEVVAEKLGPSLRWATATPSRATRSA